MSTPSLSVFFRDTFQPLWIDGRQLDHKTAGSYAESIAWWLKLTGDPPLDQITDLTVAKFIAELCKQPGRRGHKMRVSSVAKHCRQIDTVLKLAGPRSRHNRRGQGLIPEPPFVESPRQDQEPPNGDWTIDEVRAMYAACDSARYPNVEGVTPGDWWRTLIVVAYYTGLRIGALRCVEFSMLNGHWLTVPARLSKRRKGKRQYVHPEAIEHIEAIRGDREQILPWPKWATMKRYAYQRLGELQAEAGLPSHRRFSFQSFRKTHLTILAGLSLDADAGLRVAQHSAGHSSLAITAGHYINGGVQERLVAAAIDRMPSPCVRTEKPRERVYEREPEFID